MLLTADIGNTNSVFGFWHGSRLLDSVRISTQVGRTGFEWKSLLMPWLLDVAGADNLDNQFSACYCSVVPSINADLEIAFKSMRAGSILALNNNHDFPFSFDYPGRETLGADRLANVLAGTRYYGQNLIIADFGTAITYCVVRENVYIGGVIAPGYATALQALTKHTAKLPNIDFKKPQSPLGKTTTESIQVGAYFGYKGLVEELLNQLKQIFDGQQDILTIATGGVSKEFDFIGNAFDVIDRDLTLKGLKAFYEEYENQ